MKTYLLGLTITSLLMSPMMAMAESQAYLLQGIGSQTSTSGAKDVNGNEIHDGALNKGSITPFKLGLQQRINSRYCWDVFHYNEGHEKNNHRDGFGVTGCYRMRLGDTNKSVVLQINAGPYAAFNTTEIDGVQYNKKHLGLLVAAVIEKDLNNRGLKLRAELVQTHVPGSFDSRALMVGVSQAFGSENNESDDLDLDSSPADWMVMIGRTKTNSTDGAFSNQGVKVKRQAEIDTRYPGITYSISASKEGDTEITDRSGVAAQLGYKVETRGWSAGAEVGPYVSCDQKNQKTEVNGLITVFVEKMVGGGYFVRAEFERVASPNKKRAADADRAFIGVGKRFK